MPDPQERHPFLDEFQQFLGFLKSLWGLLAGVSVLFPLSNDLLNVVPLSRFDEGSLAFFAPTGVTALTTLLCLFVTLWTFGQRDRLRESARISIHRGAWVTLASGVVGLLLYWSVHYLIVGGFYFDVLGWQSADLRLILGDLVLALLYASFFTLVTRSFLLLAIGEFIKAE